MTNPARKQRSPLAQHNRHRAIVAELTGSLGGDPDTCRRELICATADLILANENARIARALGEEIDMPRHCTRIAKLLSILTKLGFRAPKPPEPVEPAEPEEETLADYLKHKEAELAAQRALGFTDEEDQEPCMEFSLDDEAAEPSASELPEQPVITPVVQPVAVTKSVALDVRELGRISGETEQSFAQVLDERAKK